MYKTKGIAALFVQKFNSNCFNILDNFFSLVASVHLTTSNSFLHFRTLKIRVCRSTLSYEYANQRINLFNATQYHFTAIFYYQY